MRAPLAPGLVLGLLAATSLGAAGVPPSDVMVHMDLSTDPPRYIPSEFSLAPGGLVQLMLFGKGASHSLSLEAGPEAVVPPGEHDGLYARTAEFRAPTAPGAYPFFDRASAARGVLHVVAEEGAASGPAVDAEASEEDAVEEATRETPAWGVAGVLVGALVAVALRRGRRG